jgi:mRNA interferase MazF
MRNVRANAPLLGVTFEPDGVNGLQKPSQIMVDKAMTVKCTKIGQVFGWIDCDTMVQVDRCLSVFRGLQNKSMPR